MHPRKLLHRAWVSGVYWPFMSISYKSRASGWHSTLTGKFLYVDLETRSAIQATVEERPRKPNSVRVVCLSDTHEAHEYVSVPDGDLLLHCGDLFFQDWSESGSLARLREFNSYLGSLPHPHKVVIAGNHDQILEDLGLEGAQKALSNATYLQDSEIVLEELGGLRIYGSPASPAGHSGNNAFQREGRSPGMQEVWGRIPSNVDILMTHGSNDLLSQEILKKRPAVHVSGHFHGHYGARFHQDHTVLINAAIMDGRYHPTHTPVVFDYVPPNRVAGH